MKDLILFLKAVVITLIASLGIVGLFIALFAQSSVGDKVIPMFLGSFLVLSSRFLYNAWFVKSLG